MYHLETLYGPMEEFDTHETNEQYDEEEMFLHEVIRDEHELLYLDSYLKEAFGNGSTI